jgi:hypothetical protein
LEGRSPAKKRLAAKISTAGWPALGARPSTSTVANFCAAMIGCNPGPDHSNFQPPNVPPARARLAPRGASFVRDVNKPVNNRCAASDLEIACCSRANRG